MFTSGYRESTDATITIGDVRHEVFTCVLSFLYTGKPREIDPEMAVEVMGVANLYSIEPLKRLCADLITRSVCVQNVATVLQAADTYQVMHLRQHCINFMVEHFAEVRAPRPAPSHSERSRAVLSGAATSRCAAPKEHLRLRLPNAGGAHRGVQRARLRRKPAARAAIPRGGVQSHACVSAACQRIARAAR